MRWLLRRGERGVVHRAVLEGGGQMVLMMTACGLSIRWDQPHAPWQRARTDDYAGVTCRRCLA
jgi:hypothetical protein